MPPILVFFTITLHHGPEGFYLYLEVYTNYFQ